jgi:hypothetical protein
MSCRTTFTHHVPDDANHLDGPTGRRRDDAVDDTAGGHPLVL